MHPPVPHPPCHAKHPGKVAAGGGGGGGSGRGFVSGGGSAHRHTCGNKSTCGLPCFTPELALVSSWAMFQGLLRGVGEGWVWAGREEIHGVCEPLGSPGWAGVWEAPIQKNGKRILPRANQFGGSPVV